MLRKVLKTCTISLHNSLRFLYEANLVVGELGIGQIPTLHRSPGLEAAERSLFYIPWGPAVGHSVKCLSDPGAEN